MKSEKKVQEPLIHVVKRGNKVLKNAWIIRVAAVVLALLVCTVLILVMTDQSPVEVFESIFEGAIGIRGVNVMALLQSAAMLLCISLAVTPAFKMKFWNIGAEGQVLMGGLAAAACMICLRGVVPNGVLILLIFLTGILAAPGTRRGGEAGAICRVRRPTAPTDAPRQGTGDRRSGPEATPNPCLPHPP